MTRGILPPDGPAASPFATAAPSLAANTYSPIPIRPDGKMPGTYVGGEWRITRGWQKYCGEQPSAFMLQAWSAWPAANVGVALGRGVIAFDIDRDELVEPILACLPPVVVAKRGRKGVTAFFRGDTDAIRSKGFRIRTDGKKLGIMDLIAEGKQTVIPPSIHPDSGEPYHWTTERTLLDTKPADLTECTAEHYEAVLDYLRSIGWEEDEREHIDADGVIAVHVGVDGVNVFRELNDLALANLGAWVPRLGLQTLARNGAGFRSVAEWRDSYSGKSLFKRERHVSFHRDGIVDYGDGERGLTAIDVVMACHGATFNQAIDWLEGALGRAPATPMLLNQSPKAEGHTKPERPAALDGAAPALMPIAAPTEAEDGDDEPPPEEGPAWPLALGVEPREGCASKAPGTASPRTSYPIEMLGDVLSAATDAIACKVQCPTALAAQSILAVAGLGAQGIADVRMPFGQVRPLSLYALTVAQSGDRKSTADNEAMAPVRVREEELRDTYAAKAVKHAARAAAWRAEHEAIKRKKTSLGVRAHEFEALGPDPVAPVQPILTIADATHEGLASAMPQLPGSIGLFSDEGARLLGGHGFTAENKAATAANFSTLWDRGNIRRLRRTTGITDLQNRRLAIHLMIQPSVAAGVVSDPELRGQGLLARFLTAAPDTMAGTRFWKEPSPATEAAIRRFAARILSLLRMVGADSNEITPRALTIDAEATAVWIDFHDQIEADQRRDGPLSHFRDIAGKAAEQAARIAGVLTIVDDLNATEIKGATMRRACAIAGWYVGEAVRVFTHGEENAVKTDADMLREWLGKKGLKEVSEREIARGAPAQVRKSNVRKSAIETLMIAGHLIPLSRSKWRVAP